MREIEFRGKRWDGGEWIYGHLVECDTREYRVFVVTSADWEQHSDGLELITTTTFEVDPKTVGRYTGLKDKNGVRIFEGDIVQRNLKNESRVFLVEIKTVRRFMRPYSGFAGDSTLVDITGVVFTWGDFHLFPTVSNGAADNERMQIIGNIRDNPKLLEVKPHD